MRMLSHAFVLILLIGSSYAIFLAVERLQTNSATSTDIRVAIEQGWMGIWLFIQSFQVNNELKRERESSHYLFRYKLLSSFEMLCFLMCSTSVDTLSAIIHALH